MRYYFAAGENDAISSVFSFTVAGAGNFNNLFARSFGAICYCGPDVRRAQFRIFRQQLALAHSIGQMVEDKSDPNSSAPDTRHAAADLRIDRNALEEGAHIAHLIEQAG